MTDMGTFERELSDGLQAEASRVDPDVAAARAQLDARLNSAPVEDRPNRSSFLAVAAAAIVVAGAAVGYQYVNQDPDQIDATNASVLSSTPDDESATSDDDEPSETEVAPTTTAPPADLEDGSPADATGDEVTNGQQLAWNEVPAPMVDRSVGNAVQIESRQWDPQDPDDVTRVDTVIWTDDGRSVKPFNGEYVDQVQAGWLDALVVNRSSDAEEAVHAMLRTADINPDTATRNTIETRTWGMAGALLTSGNLNPDEWADALRALATIDGVTFSDQVVDDERLIVVEAANRPGGERWTISIDGISGQPIEQATTGRDGSILRFVEFFSSRVEVPPPAVDDAAAAAAMSVVVSHLGIHVEATGDGEAESLVILGADHDEVASTLTASLGEPISASRLCESRAEGSASLTQHSWPGVHTFSNDGGQFTGWALTSNDIVTTDDGLGVGSTVSDLQAVYPGVTLVPGPGGPSAWIDRVVYVATSENPTSLLTEVTVGEVCTSVGSGPSGDESSGTEGGSEADPALPSDTSNSTEVDG